MRFFRTTVIKCPLKKSRTFDQIQLHLEKKDITRTPLTEITNTRSFSDHKELDETDNRFDPYEILSLSGLSLDGFTDFPS